jgi:putative acetyltransferase
MAIRAAQFPADTQALIALIGEYVAWLNIDMAFQNFDQEMAQIDQHYSLPRGMFWVLQLSGQLVGGVGFKHLDATTAEVKRLYVQPAYRGQQWGDALMRTVIDATRELGYQRLVLDTVPQTAGSHALYQRLGFVPIAPYYSGPTLATEFFQLALRSAQRQVHGASTPAP